MTLKHCWHISTTCLHHYFLWPNSLFVDLCGRVARENSNARVELPRAGKSRSQPMAPNVQHWAFRSLLEHVRHGVNVMHGYRMICFRGPAYMINLVRVHAAYVYVELGAKTIKTLATDRRRRCRVQLLYVRWNNLEVNKFRKVTPQKKTKALATIASTCLFPCFSRPHGECSREDEHVQPFFSCH